MTTPLWILLALLLGGGGGAVIAYLISDRKSRAALADATTQRALADQRIVQLGDDVQRLEREHAARLAEQAAQHQAIVSTTQLLQQRCQTAELRVAEQTAQLAAADRNLIDQRALLNEAHEKLTNAFAVVSRDALARSGETFLQMAEAKFQTLSTQAAGTLDERKAQIATLLKPLEEMLGTYQKRLAETEAQRTDAYGELRQQIGAMSQVQTALTGHTAQLISALSRPQVRGQWGEITLRKLVELAGMSARCDFFEQTNLTNEDGKMLRPDMVVHLPADRRVVIDCKAVLGAFLDAAAATDDTIRQAHLARHSRLIRDRANDLAGKKYWSQFENAPEFVVLFLPGESFLYAACEQDTALLEDCIANRVIIATPTTLIALLKSIEYGWRQQAVSENAAEIRALGMQIYDRLATLAGNMNKLGKSLDAAVDNFNKSVATLDTRLVVSARKIGELGARSDTEIETSVTIDKRARELSPTLHPDKSPLLPE
jgi:DNA recombination protein RmuC